jgi:hypothetical protein
MKNFLFILLSLFIFVGSAQARSTVPLVNLENEAISAFSGKPLTLDDVSKALRLAAFQRGWRIEEVGPGAALATLEVRGKHTVKVDITYTEKSISFKYKDSINMKYANEEGQAVIHPFYSKWVRNLLSDIHAELVRL